MSAYFFTIVFIFLATAILFCVLIEILRNRDYQFRDFNAAFQLAEIGEYKLPCVENFERNEIIVFHDAAKHSSTAKGKKNGENEEHVNIENEDVAKDGDCMDIQEDDIMNEEGNKENTTRLGLNLPTEVRHCFNESLVSVLW